MNWFESLILGILQGLTEFLPISSSGHLELGKHFLNVEARESLQFTVVVHGATVISTIVVFWKEITFVMKDLFRFRWNEGTRYILKILLSMIPVIIVGIFFKPEIERLFTANVRLVGLMLIVTSALLAIAYFSKPSGKEIPYSNALVIGIAQAFAVIPGISRSGATIATGLILRNKRDEVARFSFLMVLLPIIGANILDLVTSENGNNVEVGAIHLIIGFVAAFIVGLIACRWMIRIVRRGELIYFAFYCLILGLIALIVG
ncbi:MAG: undecaprenyl-diphosphate phosphatase [Bacteroidales bacterium]|nr:MAG: undecaprenyl-diphosphate phosphatase [Bacteroidales bacterium]